MAAMRLTPWEEERLLIFTAAELARRHRAAGLPLNAPEAIALICDAMLEAARAGAELRGGRGRRAGGRRARTRCMPGVRELVDEVRLEVLMGDGHALVVLLDPLGGRRAGRRATGPGCGPAAAAAHDRPDAADRDASS